MNRKTVVKTPALILVITLFVSVMTGCGMKDTKSTETSTKTEIESDTIQTSDSSVINSTETSQTQSLPYDGNYPQHKAYGTGIGAMPGRVENAPSKTNYTDGNGHTVSNLGVHEHWNNSEQKLYSRNLGKEEGIELVQIK